MSTFKTGFIGGTINEISSGRLFPRLDQREDFQIPKRYLANHSNLDLGSLENSKNTSECTTILDVELSNANTPDSETGKVRDEEKGPTKEKDEKVENEKRGADEKQYVIVDWYDDNDQENPQ